MTTEQTAQQLELAAQILRTGHPWEYRHIAGSRHKYNTPIEVVADGNFLSPLLATPPDNRPLHNPDNLTAEQVGVGYRLALKGESAASPHDFWDGDTWKKAKLLGPAIFAWCCRSCRLPLSVPWPEPEKPDPYAELKAAHAAGKAIQYRATRGDWSDWPKDQTPDWLALNTLWRIKPTESAKPDAPAFTLPPPPPGMRWHREDGWTADDLPQGYRPLVDGENWVAGDEILRFAPSGWQIGGTPGDILDEPTHGGTSRCRTTRPLVFNHAGKTWTWHRPGDPMPCDGEALVECLCDHGGTLDVARAKVWSWNGNAIGWRYAEPQTKTVPLGPEDVPPCCAFRRKDEPMGYIMPTSVYIGGIYGHDEIVFRQTWEYLKEHYQINRSIPLTGKWNPDAWEPCSKQIPA